MERQSMQAPMTPKGVSLIEEETLLIVRHPSHALQKFYWLFMLFRSSLKGSNLKL